MTVSTHPRGTVPLSGHSTVGTIVIRYHFPSGTQDQSHPSPGQPYRGTSRVAYLPVSLYSSTISQYEDRPSKLRNNLQLSKNMSLQNYKYRKTSR